MWINCIYLNKDIQRIYSKCISLMDKRLIYIIIQKLEIFLTNKMIE